MHGDRLAAASPDDGVDCLGERPHMIPMAMGDGDLLDLAEVERQVSAVADENRPFGTGVEKQHMLGFPDTRTQTQAVAKIGGQQRLAGNHLGAAENDVGELRHGKQRLADIGVADIVGDNLDRERVDD